MNKAKHSILSIVVVFLMVFSVIFSTSCKRNREYDEAEVLVAGEALLKSSVTLNEIYYGRGIPYNPDMNLSSGSYFEADRIALSALGIKTVEDMKTLTRKTFSSSLSNVIINTKIASVNSDDGTVFGMGRYAPKLSFDDEETIFVYKDADVLLTDTVIYHYETLSVVGSVGERVLIEVSVTVINPEGKEKTQTIDFYLIEEEAGWRLDSPTYIKYSDNGKYEELQKEKEN